MADGRTLFLIDGNSLAYRAFFALPEGISTSRGEPTNAILGFASMLAKLLGEHDPAAVIVVWDAGMSGREETYPAYKAGRPPRPDLLREQWPHLLGLVEAFGWRNVSVDGYEADDVIASLAEDAKGEGIPVIVVTGDRDALQLVDGERVRVMATSRGVTDTRLYDEDAVVDRYGIPPALMPDFIGLRGDTSDNIPGVPGIGDKTAATLLGEFGSLESVLASIDRVTGEKRRRNLGENAEVARMSRDLATLERGIDCGIDVGAELGRPVDRSGLRAALERFEFRQLIERIEGAGRATLERSDPSSRAGPALAIREGGIGDLPAGDLSLAVDTAAAPGGVRFAAATQGEEVAVGVVAEVDAVLAAAASRRLVAHDAKAILRLGSGRAEPPLRHDTMVAAYLLDPARRRYPLEELAREAGVAVGEPEAAGLPEWTVSLAARAALAREVAVAQRRLLRDGGLERLFDDVEMPVVTVLAAMERAGVAIDGHRLGEIEERVAGDVEELEREIHLMAGREFTIGSPQQLSHVLFSELGLTRKRRGKTGYSTDAKVLRAIRDEHPIVKKIEAWRELTKLKSTYLDALPRWIDSGTGRLHTTFHQCATATGRLSSSDPNLQNVPVRTALGREIRDCFVSPPGHRLISADYSQVELRVLAHVADEPVLKEIFARGEDVHSATAAQVFGVSIEEVSPSERSRAKAVNFGIIYGQSPFGLSQQLEIPGDEAAAYIASYRGRFPAVQEFVRRTIEEAEREGGVRTMMGRVRAIPELKSRQPNARQLGERLAVNTVIQGSAADIIKVAMVECHRALAAGGLETRLVLQIHDELLFECPDGEVDRAREIVVDRMAGAYPLDPPLVVDWGVGETWMRAKGP